ncbi:MFS transporter [Microbacterium indicum]|uniref:MFS transporter n=1 Tax=Microbacterium indicum TaxID=358100 RepID=UPI00048D735C|nr:MFS transporter [Microbacterium indicum]
MARWLALGLLFNSLGTGLYGAVLILYFVGGVHLPAAQVGVVSTVAAVGGLLFLPAAGSTLDRHRAVKVGTAFLIVEAAAMVWLAFADSIVAFGIGALVAAFAAQGSKVARGVLNAHIAPAGQRGKVRAQLRSCANLGIASGAAIAALAVTVLPGAELRWLLIGNALTFLVLAAVYLTKLRDVQPATDQRAAASPHRSGTIAAWTDKTYVVVMSMNGVLGVQYAALTVGVPLLVATSPDLPNWLAPAALLVNTAIVVLCQAPVSARVDGVPAAGRSMLFAGLILGTSSAGFVLALLMGGGSAGVALILALVVVHSLGEIVQVAGAFDLSYDLADQRYMGSYQGVYAWTSGVGSALGPGIWSVAIASGTFWGAPVIGAGFIAAGVAAWAATRPSTASSRGACHD